MAPPDDVEELRRELAFYKAQCERLREELSRLKRALKALRDSGAPLPHWVSTIDLEDRPPAPERPRLSEESMRRLVYKAALEAYRKRCRPVKPSEVQDEAVKLSEFIGVEPPSREAVNKLLRDLASRETYGCEPPLLKVEGGYVPRDALLQDSKASTLDYFI
ncbi:hypothetical protein B6U99_04210 [Candidatus Geothermarchaeota archaeon ex4572_27]|nr:MAG: hypothetical protein B6U99_04210 [Candidatus Geothermarchaeota archaeon ex4572_27]